MWNRWRSREVAFAIAALSCTPACASDFTVREAAEACSGIASVDVHSKGANLKYEDYSLTVETTGSLTVKQAGVLLKKIDHFNYSDYTGCVIDLTKTMIGIAAPTQTIPVDLFNKVRMGDFGRTSLSYFNSLFGPASDTVDDDDDRKIATYLSDGYIIRVQYLWREQNEVVGLRVSVDRSRDQKRGQIVIGGYWGGAEPNAVLGVTTMAKGFGSIGCDPSYSGGLITNSDPAFRCAHDATHSEGWVGTSIEMEYMQVAGGDTNDGDTYDLFRLRDEYYGQDSGLDPLDDAAKQQLEKAIGITTSDKGFTKKQKIDAAIMNSLGPHVVTGFQIYHSLTGAPIDADDRS
jgi:hypothetical protein